MQLNLPSLTGEVAADSTKKNLEMRGEAENGTAAKLDPAKLACKGCKFVRFINHGKLTAQNINIQYAQEFIDSLPNENIRLMLNKQKDKKCIIGVGQYYDLYIGSNELRGNPSMVPLTGVITYQSDGETYSSDIFVDLENYTMFFSSVTEHDEFMKVLKDGVKELKSIAMSTKK